MSLSTFFLFLIGILGFVLNRKNIILTLISISVTLIIIYGTVSDVQVIYVNIIFAGIIAERFGKYLNNSGIIGSSRSNNLFPLSVLATGDWLWTNMDLTLIFLLSFMICYFYNRISVTIRNTTISMIIIGILLIFFVDYTHAIEPHSATGTFARLRGFAQANPFTRSEYATAIGVGFAVALGARRGITRYPRLWDLGGFTTGFAVTLGGSRIGEFENQSITIENTNNELRRAILDLAHSVEDTQNQIRQLSESINQTLRIRTSEQEENCETDLPQDEAMHPNQEVLRQRRIENYENSTNQGSQDLGVESSQSTGPIEEITLSGGNTQMSTHTDSGVFDIPWKNVLNHISYPDLSSIPFIENPSLGVIFLGCIIAFIVIIRGIDKVILENIDKISVTLANLEKLLNDYTKEVQEIYSAQSGLFVIFVLIALAVYILYRDHNIVPYAISKTDTESRRKVILLYILIILLLLSLISLSYKVSHLHSILLLTMIFPNSSRWRIGKNL